MCPDGHSLTTAMPVTRWAGWKGLPWTLAQLLVAEGKVPAYKDGRRWMIDVGSMTVAQLMGSYDRNGLIDGSWTPAMAKAKGKKRAPQ